MNWDYTGTKSYVDIIPPTPFFHPNPAYERPQLWTGPQADARLKPGILRQPCSSDQLRPSIQQTRPLPVHGSGQPHSNVVLPSQRLPLLRTTSLPPVDPSKQLASTPELHQSAHSPASSQNTPAISQSGFTPPNSATLPGRQTGVVSRNTNMNDPRRAQGQQRPLMGPPETPSRVMQASPNMFPTLQFSPDLFSAQSMGPATAPIYPQQRLFWDSPGTQPENLPADHFPNPYQDSFDASFHSSSTIVPNYSPVVSQDGAFDLPQQTPSTGPFLDTTAFPMSFHTSPRPPPPTIENPTQFLSSPARRIGGAEISTASSLRQPTREVPAYHHQIEESRRERELQKRRNKNASKRADADLIMSSVKRALSPSKSFRPGMKRSVTHSGVLAAQQQHRRPSRVSFNDSASASSAASGASSRNGRSSPAKGTRQKPATLSRARSSQKLRTAMSLAIDENGVARTILQEVSESDNDMDVDEDSPSVISSDDDGDLNMIHSQTTSFAFDDDDTHLPRRVGSGRGHTSHVVTNNRGIMAPSNPRGLKEANVPFSAGKGDAQKALRAIIEDRSRSVSAQSGYPSSRQSDSSIQFHSSPPVQQNQFGEFNASPTTITDPDLATPSTDQESYGSLGATRCICNSMSPDGSTMIQCVSCSKWLHARCIGVDTRRRSDSDVYICVYCEQTPVRHPSNRGSVRSSMRGTGNSASPLAHKSIRPNRGR